MISYTTTSNLAAFFYELLRDHVVAGDIEALVCTSERDGSTEWVLSNGHLAAYSEELAVRLTTDLRSEIEQGRKAIDIERLRVNDLIGRLQKMEKVVAMERESLASWLRSRIAQQEQACAVTYISAETKANLEMEIGLARRYLEIVLTGKHPPDLSLIGEWRE